MLDFIRDERLVAVHSTYLCRGMIHSSARCDTRIFCRIVYVLALWSILNQPFFLSSKKSRKMDTAECMAFASWSFESIMVLFGVSGISAQTIDRWYLVRGRGPECFLVGPQKFTYNRMIYASVLHIFVAHNERWWIRWLRNKHTTELSTLPGVIPGLILHLWYQAWES